MQLPCCIQLLYTSGEAQSTSPVLSMASWRPPDITMGKLCTTTLGPCPTPAPTHPAWSWRPLLADIPAQPVRFPRRCLIPEAALVPHRCPVPGWSGEMRLGWQALPCRSGELPVLWNPVASGLFLNLVVPLSILKIHSFPAAMVKHDFKRSAKRLHQADAGALWHVLHIRLAQLGNTKVLNNSARDFRRYLTERLSHSWLRHCQSEGRGCGQEAAVCPHRPTCQAQLTAGALWHSPCSTRLPLCHPCPTVRHKDSQWKQVTGWEVLKHQGNSCPHVWPQPVHSYWQHHTCGTTGFNSYSLR